MVKIVNGDAWRETISQFIYFTQWNVEIENERTIHQILVVTCYIIGSLNLTVCTVHNRTKGERQKEKNDSIIYICVDSSVTGAWQPEQWIIILTRKIRNEIIKCDQQTI